MAGEALPEIGWDATVRLSVRAAHAGHDRVARPAAQEAVR
jgi:hypothetical protein